MVSFVFSFFLFPRLPYRGIHSLQRTPSAILTGMADTANSQRRRFQPTPGHFLVAAVEAAAQLIVADPVQIGQVLPNGLLQASYRCLPQDLVQVRHTNNDRPCENANDLP